MSIKIITVAATATALTLAGTAVATAAPAAHRSLLSLHATSSHTVAAPTAARPGTAEISNTGSHPIFLALARGSASRTTFAHDLNASTAAGMIAHFTVADLLPGHTVTYLPLARGTYYLADSERDTFTAASIATLKVAGSAVDAVVPAAHAVTVGSHGTLTAPTTLSTHTELRMTNGSSHLQEVALAAVGTKVTPKAVSAFLAKPSFAGLAKVDPSFAMTLLGLFSPGRHATSRVSLTKGRYIALAEELPTHGSGEPVLRAGQARLVTVK